MANKFLIPILFIITVSAVAQGPSILDFEQQIMDIVQDARPFVASVTSCQNNNQMKYCGVILEDGYVITVAGAVDKSKDLCVINSGKKYDAEVVGVDRKTNLALLKVDSTELRGIAHGDSSQLRVGAFLISIGNPYGLSQSASFGIVSGLNRSVRLNGSPVTGLIQTTAPINPGDAGGLVVDSKGRFVGLVFSTLGQQNSLLGSLMGPQGIHFVLPANTVYWVSKQLIDKGKVLRGAVGMQVRETENRRGVKVISVAIDGPAAKSGIKKGDLLTHIDDKAIDSCVFLLHYISHRTENETIALRVVDRDSAMRTVKIRLGKLK